jgi:sterol desaturase/sphingolipid hydroxylase (fatty acid hydroxylase superfamily)
LELNILIFTLLVLAGHAAGGLAFYLTHRFIFHGKLGTLPILNKIKSIHTRHHAKPDSLERALFPTWAKILIAILMACIGFISLSFALGVCSFFPVYAHRHWKAHNGSEAYWAKHHMHHHLKDPNSNFGGIYPIMDRVFGTNSNK